ncbi:MAG: SPFH domain-containing protein [bacterium]
MYLGLIKILLLIIAAGALFTSTFKILKEYERVVVFRLGKLHSSKGPGLIFLIPLVDRVRKVDLRLVSIDVPRQEIMTRDNVPVTVDAVVYFQITDPARAIIRIQNIYQSTFLIAQTTLRSILGQVNLDDLLCQQEKINTELQQVISDHTSDWGISIPIVEIKEITLPEEMKRVMAKQAETERERRARIIDAEGEYQAAQTLVKAGKILSDNPQSLQLRYLQTMRDMSVQKGSTIVFPFPLDLLSAFKHYSPEKKGPEHSRQEKGSSRQNTEAPSFQDFPAQSKMPQFVQWLSTDRCQFNCSHCDTTSKQANPKELTTRQVLKAIDELASLGCEFLSIIGGEPLLRRDIFDITHYAHQKGIKVGLTTNGQATEDHLAALEQAHFDSVAITLDGYRDAQDRIRKSNNAYERGIRSIEFFHDVGVPSISVTTILLEENIRELSQLTEEVFRCGARRLQLQPLLYRNGAPERNTPELVKQAFRFVLEARRRGFMVELSEAFGYLGPLESLVRAQPFSCGSGWNTFCLNSEGDVTGCAVPGSVGREEGNFLTSSLKNIWARGFADFRGKVPSSLPDECKRCSHLSRCRGGCWLFRVQGLNPCFLPEAEQIYQEISHALYTEAHEGKSEVLPG